MRISRSSTSPKKPSSINFLSPVEIKEEPLFPAEGQRLRVSLQVFRMNAAENCANQKIKTLTAAAMAGVSHATPPEA
mgnify:CR=1 FL=1